MTPDPFDILGLSPRWDLSGIDVERAYLRRVATVHPDLGTDAGDADATSQLNLAKAELLNPQRRAEVLLERLGGASAAQDKSLPKGFLAQVMTQREEIEESLASDTDGLQRERWRAAAELRRAAHLARLSELFAAGTIDALLAIRTELNAMRYTQRLIEQLDPGYRPGPELTPPTGGNTG